MKSAGGGRPEAEGKRIGGILSGSDNSPAPTNDGQTYTVTGASSGKCVGL